MQEEMGAVRTHRSEVEDVEVEASPGGVVAGSLESWLEAAYPHLHDSWLRTSGSLLLQGGVGLWCSACRRTASRGFQRGRPLCEVCRAAGPADCSACRSARHILLPAKLRLQPTELRLPAGRGAVPGLLLAAL